MDGYEVKKMINAIENSDIIVTATKQRYFRGTF